MKLSVVVPVLIPISIEVADLSDDSVKAALATAEKAMRERMQGYARVSVASYSSRGYMKSTPQLNIFDDQPVQDNKPLTPYEQESRQIKERYEELVRKNGAFNPYGHKYNKHGDPI